MTNLRTPTAEAPRGYAVRSRWVHRLLTFLVVCGPGLIVMEADNDAGAVATYTQAGAQYGTHLLWVLLLLLPITYFVQEMVVRLGIATGRGHAGLVHRRLGRSWGRFSLANLLVLNFLTLVTEFAMVDLAARHAGFPPGIAVPLAGVALMALVLSGSYRRWERLTIALCLLDVVWFALALRLGPPAGQVVRDTFVPSLPGGLSGSLVFCVIAIVGTTIAPWQLFFQQSCVADKQLRYTDLGSSRLDTLVGAVFTILVAGAMMLVGDAARRHGIEYRDPGQMAEALGLHLGQGVRVALLILMVNAALLGSTAISLSSAWAYGEVKGWAHSLDLKLWQAPKFYAVYVACVAAAGALVLIPGAPLQTIILSVQVLAGIMLPAALVFLQLLLNDRELLGEFANRAWNNLINWTIVALLFGLSLVLAVQVLCPRLCGAAG